MLSAVSWSQFFTTLLFLLLIYYFFVISLFYKKEILRLFIAQPKPDDSPFNIESGSAPLSVREITKTNTADDALQRQDIDSLQQDLKT